VDTLHQAGLKVVLGHTDRDAAEMAGGHNAGHAAGGSGRLDARKFGSRRHYDFSHDGYLEEPASASPLRLPRPLAASFASAPGRPTMNMTATTPRSPIPGGAQRPAFSAWLQRKYQSPDALNRAWGNVFWSMEISEFSDEVELPNLTVTEANPAHVMDFRRYCLGSWWCAFNKAQADIIRAHSPGAT
jgi:beta-galactosidase